MGNDTSQPVDNDIARSLIIFTIVHGLVLAIGIAILLFFVPIIAELLSDMSDGTMQLPTLTRVVLDISQFALKFSYMCLLFVFPVLIAVVSIYYVLLRFSGKHSARVWSAIVLLSEGSLIGVCIIAMILPVIQISETLK